MIAGYSAQTNVASYMSMKSLSDSAWVGIGVVAFDIATGRTSSNQLMYDFVSLFGAEYLSNILSSIILPTSISPTMTQFIKSGLTGILYMYIYDMWGRGKVNSISDRTSYMNAGIGFLSSYILNMVSNPFNTLLGVV
jgi:hypothetical protein